MRRCRSTLQDKYVLLAMIMLTLVCVWHGITTLLVLYDVNNIKLYDVIALCAFGLLYFLFNAIFLLRIYMKVFHFIYRHAMMTTVFQLYVCQRSYQNLIVVEISDYISDYMHGIYNECSNRMFT
jgi:hypothetical protein